MQDTIRGMRSKRAEGDTGFTMIELLVVVVIIGVLVAIAVPVYLNYRKGAANKSAASDVRASVSAVEQYYTENSNTYPAAGAIVGDALTFTGIAGGSDQKAMLSPSNTLGYARAADGRSYVVCGLNSDGGTVYVYNSSVGGSVKKSSQTTLANCLTNGN